MAVETGRPNAQLLQRLHVVQLPIAPSVSLPIQHRARHRRKLSEDQMAAGFRAKLAARAVVAGAALRSVGGKRSARRSVICRQSRGGEESEVAVVPNEVPLDEDRACTAARLAQTVADTRARVEWSLEEHGFELLELPVGEGAECAHELALQAGMDMQQIASVWRSIKNGDDSRGRRQSYLRMRKHIAPISSSTADVLAAAQQIVRQRIGARTIFNDVVVIADFESTLPRQELHRDVRRDAIATTTCGVLVPLDHGVRLHAIPGSHTPRTALRAEFANHEVVVVDVPVGCVLVWDGHLVHAGDGALSGPASGFVEGKPNRPRMHAYAEQPEEERPYDDKGDRGIIELL